MVEQNLITRETKTLGYRDLVWLAYVCHVSNMHTRETVTKGFFELLD